MGSFFLFFRGEGQALASSNSTKTKSEKLRKGTRREEKKREPKGDINKRQILPAVKIFYFLLSKLANLDAKNDLNRNVKTSECFFGKRRAEEKISLISGSTAEDVQTPMGAHNNSGLIFPSCCLD